MKLLILLSLILSTSAFAYIPISSNFLLGAPLALDADNIQANDAARDALPNIRRYDGKIVYVVADQVNWQLQGGITNSNWVPIVSGSGTTPGGITNSIQFNNSGAFDGNSYFTYDPSTGIVLINSSSNAGEMDFGAQGAVRYDGFGNLTITQTNYGQQLSMNSGGSVTLQDGSGSSGGMFMDGAGNTTFRKNIEVIQTIEDTSDLQSIDANNRIAYANDGATPSINWSNPTITVFDGNLQTLGNSILFGTAGSLADDGAGNIKFSQTSTNANLLFGSTGTLNLNDQSNQGLSMDGSGHSALSTKELGSSSGVNLTVSPIWNTSGNPIALAVNPTNTASGTGAMLQTWSTSSTVQAQMTSAGKLSAKTLTAGSATALPLSDATIVSFGHENDSQMTAPTAAPQAGAGGGASCTVSSGSTDMLGTVTISTGATSLAAGPICKITFFTPYTNAPKCWIEPVTSAGVVGVGAVGVYKSSTGGPGSALTINFAASPVALTNYSYDYGCKQIQ